MRQLLLLAFALVLWAQTAMAQVREALKQNINQSMDQLTDEQMVRLNQYIENLKEEEKHGTQPDDSSDKARGFWKNQRMNVGEIQRGTTLSLPFVYENMGDVPYRVDRVLTNCECVEVRIEDASASEGRPSKIQLLINTNEMPGLGHQTIIVFIYDNSAPTGKNFLFVDLDLMDGDRPAK